MHIFPCACTCTYHPGPPPRTHASTPDNTQPHLDHWQQDAIELEAHALEYLASAKYSATPGRLHDERLRRCCLLGWAEEQSRQMIHLPSLRRVRRRREGTRAHALPHAEERERESERARGRESERARERERERKRERARARERERERERERVFNACMHTISMRAHTHVHMRAHTHVHMRASHTLIAGFECTDVVRSHSPHVRYNKNNNNNNNKPG
jgi:hypothetical protein